MIAVVSPDPSSVVADCDVIEGVVAVSCSVVWAFDSVEDGVFPATVVSVVPLDDVVAIGRVADDVVVTADVFSDVIASIAFVVVPVVLIKDVAVVTLLVDWQFTLAAAKKANFTVCF